tara:strand:+ start:143 stop:1126 length:984 start_codon:yes stop_codon:yes gene_type:complete
MATYKDLHGTRVNVVSSNPSNPKEGQVWYNSTLGTLKGYVLAPASVSSGGNLGTARTQAGGAGTQTAGLIYGGETPSITNATEEYDGSSWTAGGTCPASKTDMHASGTQTAALWGGGSPSSSASFEYDGSSWTGTGAMTFAGRDFSGGCVGIQTAALQIGGFISPGNLSATMQYYDGSSWTNIPQTFPTAPNTSGMASCGTQTAALSAGGPSGQTVSLSWDGSSWTSTPSLNIGASAAVHRGTSTDSLFMTGHPANPPSYGVEIQTFDGSSWSTSPLTFSNARAQAVGAGTASAAYVSGGANGNPTPTNTTEHFDGAAVETRTLTTS